MTGHDDGTPRPRPGADDGGTVELERFPDGSRLVRPESDKQTGHNPPEEIDGTADDDGDAVSETTSGDSGGTS